MLALDQHIRKSIAQAGSNLTSRMGADGSWISERQPTCRRAEAYAKKGRQNLMTA